ncbi:RNA 5'-triphosphatase [Schizosaccharomyces octosporus yFS286]|uniref:mRNA-capping enzyme subunit beta n=1 Tax=Schizosaccharomyces octosporus (strain yFS286) TaxID=483514 RepID=S9PZS2_SCHOY|nr:RNA 5'-triphosphatase [Schizosaccharomyces octosporus yFS286]EPX72963.1 RNA 5'-triphosphatase [Schizosaccharomyces octosporus yFS286]
MVGKPNQTDIQDFTKSEAQTRTNEMDLKGLIHDKDYIADVDKKRAKENEPEATESDKKKPKTVAVAKPELNILNKSVLHDTTRTVSNFLLHYLTNEPVENIEIEAKLGTLVDLDSQNRFEFPVLSETVLNPEFNLRTRFQSDMPASEHKHFNEFLNNAFRESQRPGRVPIVYKHVKQVDLFYDSKNHGHDRVRVTRDQKDNRVLACVMKRRIADLYLYCPNDAFDVRISISDEIPVSMPPQDTPPLLTRIKDRVGYQHQDVKIDLTMTIQNDPRYESTKRHELEVEFNNTAGLRERAMRAKEGAEPSWDRRVQLFLDNIRILRRENS